MLHLTQDCSKSDFLQRSEKALIHGGGHDSRRRAARQQDAAELEHAYRGLKGLIQSIDGLQPEKRHETLFLVQKEGQKRVWFAEALISSATASTPSRGSPKGKSTASPRETQPMRGWMPLQYRFWHNCIHCAFCEMSVGSTEPTEAMCLTCVAGVVPRPVSLMS